MCGGLVLLVWLIKLLILKNALRYLIHFLELLNADS